MLLNCCYCPYIRTILKYVHHFANIAFEKLNVLPIEVKSGKERFSFKAMTKLLAVEGYRMDQGIILSNDANVYEKDHILYLPIYDVMFI